MATFIVFTRESTQDENELNIYLSKVGETLEGHPIKLHAGPHQMLEGPVPEIDAIVEFPITTAARNWYDGRADRAIAHKCFKVATYRTVTVVGMCSKLENQVIR